MPKKSHTAPVTDADGITVGTELIVCWPEEYSTRAPKFEALPVASESRSHWTLKTHGDVLYKVPKRARPGAPHDVWKTRFLYRDFGGSVYIFFDQATADLWLWAKENRRRLVVAVQEAPPEILRKIDALLTEPG